VPRPRSTTSLKKWNDCWASSGSVQLSSR
jgi:hypothetical protein